MIVSYDTIKYMIMKPSYKINNKILNLIVSISEKIGTINSAHLQKPTAELRKRNRIKTIQSSLGIEGNTLTIGQVTDLFENKRVAGPKKEITEVKNAIKAYDLLNKFDPYDLNCFCKAHSILMKDLIDSPGKFRGKSVVIVKGDELTPIPPSSDQLKPILNRLFNYLKKDKDIQLIKSCVFHYEIEYIHPFMDGNGRIGRLWQTVILKDKYPVFEFLPIETLIKEEQKKYYYVLSKSDKAGNSTIFIEFMLGIINDALENLLQSQNVSLTGIDRINLAKEIFKDSDFTRQDYLRNYKNISTATASRDLKTGTEAGIIKKIGEKRTTVYRFI